MTKDVQKSFEVMSDKGSWIFDDCDVAKIKSFDVDAVNKFYFDNLKVFKSMARKFICLHYMDNRFEFNELINQVYIDLPYYNFTSRMNLFNSIIKGTFLRSTYGGIKSKYNPLYLKQPLSIDKTFEDGEENYFLLDKIMEKFPSESFLKCEENDNQKNDFLIFDYLVKTFKKKKDLNRMYCYIFTDLKSKDIAGDEYIEFLQFKTKALKKCE